ncbi:hypothetical protein NXT01_06950 [Corynebacterium sp. ES2775-CONJ]|nr:hypothetical protein [Corynebacterium sp. ES2775-CONJ]MCS4490329.1 hypothetical protein [Corynebacterium sp. ES2775-CONJ]
MSANDIRQLENLDLIPTEDGGNLYLVNGNTLPLSQAGSYYTYLQMRDSQLETQPNEPDSDPKEDADDGDNASRPHTENPE